MNVINVQQNSDVRWKIINRQKDKSSIREEQLMNIVLKQKNLYKFML